MKPFKFQRRRANRAYRQSVYRQRLVQRLERVAEDRAWANRGPHVIHALMLRMERIERGNERLLADINMSPDYGPHSVRVPEPLKLVEP